MNKLRTLLTTLIVLTITAIAVVGFILVWDIFDFSGKLDVLLDTDLYGGNESVHLSDVSVEISSSASSNVPETERACVEKFFTLYFASLGGFYREDISDCFSFQSEDELIDNLALDCEINAAKSADADLSFSECNISYTVLSREIDYDGNVTLSVRCSYFFNYADSKVQTSGEELHSFELGSDKLIKKHSSNRPARESAVKALDTALAEKGYTQSDMSYTYYSPYIKRAEAICTEKCAELREKTSQSEDAAFFSAEYNYDREAAADYAENSRGNSAKYGSYEENDVNFCSQCLIAGGIPMDAQGDKLTQWKWYGYEENNAREHSGCTKTWYERGRFWTYATENTGFGLVAQESETAEVGDIIQLLNDGEPVLQVIVSRVIEGEYFICTDSLKNIPLSTFYSGEMRILKIIGYNTANI